MDYSEASRNYRRIEQALLFLDTHRERQPGLNEIARHIGLSDFHFQRLFSQWVGITPKRFLQFLTKEHAKGLLAEAPNVLDAAYRSGLSGPGRLHDLFVKTEAITPGEYRALGAGLTISYGFHPTPFGECLLALTERGICALAFVEQRDRQSLRDWLAAQWPRAALRENPGATQPMVDKIFTGRASPSRPLPLLLKGTNFQIKVWEALLRIPHGAVVSYETVAAAIAAPKASRAAGSAIGKNPIAYIIPCHRVIRKIGESGNYRWGRARKQAILGWEAATRSGRHGLKRHTGS